MEGDAAFSLATAAAIFLSYDLYIHDLSVMQIPLGLMGGLQEFLHFQKHSTLLPGAAFLVDRWTQLSILTGFAGSAVFGFPKCLG